MMQNTMTSEPVSNFDLELPLQPNTDNPEHVALLLDGLMGLVHDFSTRQQASSADVLQALSVATALRAAMSEIDEPVGEDSTPKLLDVRVHADLAQAQH